MGTGASLGVTAWLVIQHNLSIYGFDYHYRQYTYWAYSKPYTRIPAYFVGIAAAWMLDEMEQRGMTREAIARNRSNLRGYHGALCAKLLARFGAGVAVAVL